MTKTSFASCSCEVCAVTHRCPSPSCSNYPGSNSTYPGVTYPGSNYPCFTFPGFPFPGSTHHRCGARPRAPGGVTRACATSQQDLPFNRGGCNLEPGSVSSGPIGHLGWCR